LFVGSARATIIEYPTSQPGRVLRLVLTNAPGGLAIDKHGNIYYSDQGDGSLGNGVIKMIPKETNTPITILTGLDIPGDIELTRDGRALIVAEAYGKVKRYRFGLAAHFEGPDGTPTYGLTLYANIPGVGMTKGYRVMINDFYLLPDLLSPDNAATDIEIIVEFPSGKTVRYPVTIGQPGEDTVFGQTVKFFMLSE
jgi:hypothetical protein